MPIHGYATGCYRSNLPTFSNRGANNSTHSNCNKYVYYNLNYHYAITLVSFNLDLSIFNIFFFSFFMTLGWPVTGKHDEAYGKNLRNHILKSIIYDLKQLYHFFIRRDEGDTGPYFDCDTRNFRIGATVYRRSLTPYLPGSYRGSHSLWMS